MIIELRERVVRVEEELKHQRELIQQVLTTMDKRFDAADARFEALTRRVDRFMFWPFGITVSSAGVVIAVLRFWPVA